jgi:hypothetical protein
LKALRVEEIGHGGSLRTRGEERELCPQARHGEVDEGADLRNRKAALRCDDMTLINRGAPLTPAA